MGLNSLRNYGERIVFIGRTATSLVGLNLLGPVEGDKCSSMEAFLDEGPAGNFETSMLEFAKDAEVVENHQNLGCDDKKDKEEQTTAIPVTRNIANLPFQNVDIDSFFSDRSEVVERALKDCTEKLINEEEKDVLGSWLLTEITLWDAEKERLVLLTAKAIYSVKYDFISLKILDYNRVPLTEIDTLVNGELIYPSSSLAPRLNGLANGVSSLLHCAVRQEWSSFASCTGISQFEPRKRHLSGLRLMWNRGNPLSTTKKWNPFAKDIPWITYSSHPLFWYKGSEADKAKFDAEGLREKLGNLLPRECRVTTGAIIIENYFGLGALLHNRNNLGFFKIRGKVSF